MPGLSGLALHIPKARVSLERWCEWTGAPPDKVRAVVGDAFRVAAGDEDVYTLSANAVLRLVEAYDVDPGRLGYLVLSTESSMDNAVGGPTIKGLVDLGLAARGRPVLSRTIEAFEVKQACLSGMNALLGATRFVMTEPDKVAIVVSADIAEYARSSSGEQTQGAGAVAMLVEAEPKLLAIDPTRVGRSASDRVCDFRKPMRNGTTETYGFEEARPRDFPVFAGHYSTHCYLDTVDHAFVHHLARAGRSAAEALDRAAMVLLHRPYEKMPQTSVGRMRLRALLCSKEGRNAVEALAGAQGIDLEQALSALDTSPDLVALIRAHGVEADPAPELGRLIKSLVKSADFKAFLADKTGWGSATVRQLGNLYAASLPAWIGAALEDAAARNTHLAGSELLLFGYGSGDAALAIPAKVAETWREAAARLGFAASLESAVDIDRQTYERAHDRETPITVEATPGEVRLERVGHGSDRGVPYYRTESYSP